MIIPPSDGRWAPGLRAQAISRGVFSCPEEWCPGWGAFLSAGVDSLAPDLAVTSQPVEAADVEELPRLNRMLNESDCGRTYIENPNPYFKLPAV